MKTKIKECRMDKFLLCLYLFCVSFSMHPTINTISLYLLIPLMFILIVLKNINTIGKFKYINIYFALIIWMTLTCFTANNIEVALEYMIRPLSSFIFAFISFYLALNEKNIKWLYMIIAIRFLVIILYAYQNLGAFVVAESESDRGSEELNANIFGYFLFYFTFSIYMLVIRLKKWHIVTNVIITLFLLLISIAFSLFTASRQILVIQIPFILLLFGGQIFRLTIMNMSKILFFISILIILFIPYFETVFYDSYLLERSQVSIEDDVRTDLLFSAIKEGFEHPVFGIGPNNFVLKYNMFSHCTYTELFACCGIPALLMYLSLLFIFSLRQYKRYIMSKERSYVMFLIFSLIFAVYNFLYVYISDLWLMGFLFIVIGHSEQFYRNRLLNLIN